MGKDSINFPSRKKVSKSMQRLIVQPYYKNSRPTKPDSDIKSKRNKTENSRVIHSLFPKIREQSVDLIDTLRLLRRRRHSSFILSECIKGDNYKD